MRVLLFPYPHQHLLLCDVLILVILLGGKWYLVVVVIYISLMTNDVAYFFSALIGPLYIFHGEIFTEVLCLFFKLGSHTLLTPFGVRT